jgi:hypothetical protein
MGLCDICATEGEGTYISSSQMREAVANGFNPFEPRLVPWESQAGEFESWKGIVDQDVTDWNLCSNCYKGIRRYFSGEPAPQRIKTADDAVCKSAGSDALREYSLRISRATITSLRRSLVDTIIRGVCSVAAVVGSIALWSNEHGIWAVLVAFCLAFPLALAAYWSGEAQCPFCLEKIKHFKVGIDQCSKCGLYSEGEGGQLRPVPPGYAAEDPTFTIKIDSLKDPSDWRWPWLYKPPSAYLKAVVLWDGSHGKRPAWSRCCVCDELATREETIEFRIPPMVYKLNVGHCGAHKKGISVEIDAINFRAINSWLEFRFLNSK